jgi:hypothetical protein
MSCKKNTDYRDKYVGNYNFVVNRNIRNFINSTWVDTVINYAGEISKYGADEIKICYLPKYLLTSYIH